MIRKSLALACLLIATPATAHRLDEYLQGTILAVTKDRLSADLTLTPGVAIFPVLIKEIDTNADGTISGTEQHAYAERVLGDLSLSIDGRRLLPRLIAAEFPPESDMQEGRGEIHIEFDAALPPGGQGRKLIFENHHQNAISVYQVNVLVPRDPAVRILGQNRNYSQSLYELNFEQGIASTRTPAWPLLAGAPGLLGVILLASIALLLYVLRKQRPHRQSVCQ